jgi:hypothetical protein
MATYFLLRAALPPIVANATSATAFCRRRLEARCGGLAAGEITKAFQVVTTPFGDKGALE